LPKPATVTTEMIFKYCHPYTRAQLFSNEKVNLGKLATELASFEQVMRPKHVRRMWPFFWLKKCYIERVGDAKSKIQCWDYRWRKCGTFERFGL